MLKKLFIPLLLIAQLAIGQDQKQQEPKKIESSRNEQKVEESDNGKAAMFVLINLACIYMCYRQL